MSHATPLLDSPSMSIYDYRCGAGPHDRPFTECHGRHSISYVRRGSFGYRCGGRHAELVAGALLVACRRPGAAVARGDVRNAWCGAFDKLSPNG